jgi:hypothetical protein
MASCKTCQAEYIDERLKLGYDYCTSRSCVQKNLVPLQIAEVAVNKSNAQFLILDSKTQEELKEGKHKDQRRQEFGVPLRPSTTRSEYRVKVEYEPVRRKKLPGNSRQWVLAKLYQSQGKKPEEIAKTIHLSVWEVTQILLSREL